MRVLLLLLLAASSAKAVEITGRDQHGYEFSLSLWDEDRFRVVAFLNAGCPLGKFYANRLNELHEKYPGVCFVAVNANEGDSFEEMVEFAKRLKFPMVKGDADLGATRSPEVFLLDRDKVIYQGAIDDQYEPGVHSRSATQHYLENAISQALAGQPVSVPKTEASGCRIERPKKVQSNEVTYSHVAPIFHRKCVECHRPGQVAPFSLLTYEDAAGWSDTIRDVLTERRMPPWGADPRYGHFANDRSLTDEERRLIFQWLDAGSPAGEAPAPPKFESDFKPDLVLTAPEFTVPKEGLLDYQDFIIDPGLSEDTWVDAVEVKPGNRAVVHHATVYVQPKDAKPGMMYSRTVRDNYLSIYIPGNTSMTLPPGFAKCIPAGWNIRLSIHYVPNGDNQVDQSSIGLRLAKRAPSHIVSTRLWAVRGFELQPGETRTLVREEAIPEDWTLIALYPHMHLRGKSMLFEAIYPNGEKEILLNVPDYDFEWQHRYELAEPKALPKGTLLRCTGAFDNSKRNKRNPDPSAVVREGERTEDEMFLGVFEVAQPVPRPSFTLVYVGIVIGAVFLLRRFRCR